MFEHFFKVESRPIFAEAWGDYGNILQNGMTRRDADGNLLLERTGPYVPPVSLPGIGDMILTSGARSLLEASGLEGFTFHAVEKQTIVESQWHEWDLNAPEPAEYAATGEPEDYILGQQHNPKLALEMGDLWEVVVPISATIVRPTTLVRSYRDLYLDLTSWNGSDLIRGNGYGAPLFSQRAKDWFVAQWDRYLRFDEFPAL